MSGQRISDTATRVQGVVLATVLLVVVPTLGLLLVKWLDVAVPQSVGVAAALIVGIGLLLVLVAAVALGFAESSDSKRDAFGLPEGSIRALIALSVLLAFVAVVVYVLGTILPPGDDRNAVAQQVVGTLGTLLAAIAAFYFGANSVKSGAAALASLSPTAQLGPEAITKGTAEGDRVLVGNVNPHGLETRYFFEYSQEESLSAPPKYESQTTPPGTVPAGEDAVEVRATLPTGDALKPRTWMRLVAFNARGSSTGRDQQVGGP
jgi:protein-S-isoprenylcysteine O-methyltransferase Ste14